MLKNTDYKSGYTIKQTSHSVENNRSFQPPTVTIWIRLALYQRQHDVLICEWCLPLLVNSVSSDQESGEYLLTVYRKVLSRCAFLALPLIVPFLYARTVLDIVLHLSNLFPFWQTLCRKPSLPPTSVRVFSPWTTDSGIPSHLLISPPIFLYCYIAFLSTTSTHNEQQHISAAKCRHPIWP